jgi:hypothetical protein
MKLVQGEHRATLEVLDHRGKYDLPLLGVWALRCIYDSKWRFCICAMTRLADLPPGAIADSHPDGARLMLRRPDSRLQRWRGGFS